MTISFAQQFSIKPPSKDELARRLTGGRAASVQPAPVLKSTAPVEFFRKTESVRNQIVPSSYMLGANGGLAGFGSFGSFGGIEFLPGISFAEPWAHNDFMGDVNWVRQIKNQCGLDARYAGGLDYEKPSESLLLAASTTFKKLKDLADDGTHPDIDAFVARVTSELKSLTKQADDYSSQGWDVLCGKRTKDVESMRVSIFNRIKGQMKLIVNFVPAASSAPPVGGSAGGGYAPATGGGYVPAAGGGASGGNSVDAMLAQQAVADAARARAAQAAAEAAVAAAKARAEAEGGAKTTLGGGSSIPKLPLLIGGGVLLAGAAFTLLRKKK